MWIKPVVAVDFFLFATFSFFVEGVENAVAMSNSISAFTGRYGFPDVQGNELLLYGVLGRPRTGLFRLGVGEPALGGADRHLPTGPAARAADPAEDLPRVNRQRKRGGVGGGRGLGEERNQVGRRLGRAVQARRL